MENSKVVSSSSEGETEEEEEEEAVPELEQRFPTWLDYLADDASGRGGGKRRLLSRQLSMRETRMEAKWENRRRQIWERRMSARKLAAEEAAVRNLTDEDMDELRGSIDLGFGFSEEAGGKDLCATLPALNLYFAVNRQLSDPKLATPPSPGTSTGTSSSSTIGGHPSPRSPASEHVAADDWKIYNPGDSPQHVKTRLRHWAQVVAFTLRQNC